MFGITEAAGDLVLLDLGVRETGGIAVGIRVAQASLRIGVQAGTNTDHGHRTGDTGRQATGSGHCSRFHILGGCGRHGHIAPGLDQGVLPDLRRGGGTHNIDFGRSADTGKTAEGHGSTTTTQSDGVFGAHPHILLGAGGRLVDAGKVSDGGLRRRCNQLDADRASHACDATGSAADGGAGDVFPRNRGHFSGSAGVEHCRRADNGRIFHISPGGVIDHGNRDGGTDTCHTTAGSADCVHIDPGVLVGNDTQVAGGADAGAPRHLGRGLVAHHIHCHGCADTGSAAHRGVHHDVEDIFARQRLDLDVACTHVRVANRCRRILEHYAGVDGTAHGCATGPGYRAHRLDQQRVVCRPHPHRAVRATRHSIDVCTVLDRSLGPRNDDIRDGSTCHRSSPRTRDADGRRQYLLVAQSHHRQALGTNVTATAAQAAASALPRLGADALRSRVDNRGVATNLHIEAYATIDVAIGDTIAVNIQVAVGTGRQRRNRPGAGVAGGTVEDIDTNCIAARVDAGVLRNVGPGLAGQHIGCHVEAYTRRACAIAHRRHAHDQGRIGRQQAHVAIRVHARCGSLVAVVAICTDKGLGGVGNHVGRSYRAHRRGTRATDRDAATDQGLRRFRRDFHVGIGGHVSAPPNVGPGILDQGICIEHAAHCGRARPAATGGNRNEVAVAVGGYRDRARIADTRAFIDLGGSHVGRRVRGHDVHDDGAGHRSRPCTATRQPDIEHVLVRGGRYLGNAVGVHLGTIGNKGFRRIAHQGHTQRTHDTRRAATAARATRHDGEGAVRGLHPHVTPGTHIGVETYEGLRVAQRNRRAAGHVFAYRHLVGLGIERGLGLAGLAGGAKLAADRALGGLAVRVGLRLPTAQPTAGFAVEQGANRQDRNCTRHTGGPAASTRHHCRVDELL